jgi:glycosyltransferase involved in cell wall biosynthesis
VPLILDYRDEWSECPFDFVDHSGQDRYWEARCLASAQAVIFTTESHRRHQLSVFGELSATDVRVIPNGWEPSDFAEVTPTRVPPQTHGSIALAHVGALGGHTPPDAFLRDLDAVLERDTLLRSRVRLLLVGRKSPASRDAVDAFKWHESIESVEHVGKREAITRMREASGLLLLSNADLARYLPGKLFDYFAAGRQIIVHGTEGESSDLVEHRQRGRFCRVGDIEALAAALHGLSAPAENPGDTAAEEWLMEYRRDVLARRVFDVVEDVVSRRRPSP